jgi:hypothetical protein
MPISAIRAIERVQVHLLDRLKHPPHQVILRHPVPQRRRHQTRLLPITFDEVLSHTGMVLNPPDGIPFPDSHREIRSPLAIEITR